MGYQHQVRRLFSDMLYKLNHDEKYEGWQSKDIGVVKKMLEEDLGALIVQYKMRPSDPQINAVNLELTKFMGETKVKGMDLALRALQNVGVAREVKRELDQLEEEEQEKQEERPRKRSKGSGHALKEPNLTPIIEGPKEPTVQQVLKPRDPSSVVKNIGAEVQRLYTTRKPSSQAKKSPTPPPKRARTSSQTKLQASLSGLQTTLASEMMNPPTQKPSSSSQPPSQPRTEPPSQVPSQPRLPLKTDTSPIEQWGLRTKKTVFFKQDGIQQATKRTYLPTTSRTASHTQSAPSRLAGALKQAALQEPYPVIPSHRNLVKEAHTGQTPPRTRPLGSSQQETPQHTVPHAQASPPKQRAGYQELQGHPHPTSARSPTRTSPTARRTPPLLPRGRRTARTRNRINAARNDLPKRNRFDVPIRVDRTPEIYYGPQELKETPTIAEDDGLRWLKETGSAKSPKRGRRDQGSPRDVWKDNWTNNYRWERNRDPDDEEEEEEIQPTTVQQDPSPEPSRQEEELPQPSPPSWRPRLPGAYYDRDEDYLKDTPPRVYTGNWGPVVKDPYWEMETFAPRRGSIYEQNMDPDARGPYPEDGSFKMSREGYGFTYE